METEPSAQQFSSMQFNPFSQNFQQQQEHHQLMIMQQQQLLHQQQLQNNQQQNQDEEMEADDTTCDMKYNENDMNQMNVTMNNFQNNNCKNNEETSNHTQNAQMNQHFHHIQQQLKFGRLVNENEYFKKNKQLVEDEESYTEEDYDDEEEEDELEDYDEDLVREMLISATPDIQNIIKLIISGFSACASETLRFLMEEENLSVHSPLMVGLIDHLKTQETMLIVNCLRTQQIIKQQILANQLSGKGPFIDPKMNLTSLFLQASQLQQQHSDYKLQQKINASNASNQQLNLLMMNQLQANQNLNRNLPNHQNLVNYHNQVNIHQNPVVNHPHVLTNNVINNNINALESVSKNNSVPLTSSPVNNKPFEQINGKKLDQNVNFANNLHNAFGGNKAHSNISSQNSSAQNSPSRSPASSPGVPFFNLINQHQNQSINPNNCFPPNVTNFASNNRVNFFNQTNIMPQLKQLNDSGFSE